LTQELTVDQFYSEGNKSGKLLGLMCENGHVTVPPRHSCRVCNSAKLKVKELKGVGTVVSYTEVYAKSKEFPLATPYTLVLVQLEEGGNLLGVLDCKTAVQTGSKARVKFKSIRNESLNPTIFFELV
jgi:uncharacterized OB-fold protein